MLMPTGLWAVIFPCVALLLAAVLEVASRAAARLDVHRWAQRNAGAEVDEGTVWERIDETFTAVRLARQLSLIFVVIAVSTYVPDWLGVAAAASDRLLWAIGLSLAVWLVVDKVLAFAVVAILGPIRVLDLGRPAIVLLRLLFRRPARMLNRFQRDSRARDVVEEASADNGDLDAFLDMAEESGLVKGHDEVLLRGVAEFREVLVDNVMTPRVDIASIPANETLDALSKLVAEHKHSRIPVIGDNIDDVIGVVNIRDLVPALRDGGTDSTVGSIARPALFVPESKRVSELMREFQSRHEHLAIVVDEYGGTAGLVTLEDLLEEIVGEIQDELEEDEEQTVVQLEDGAVVAAGKAEIEDVEELLHVEIGDDEFETVGGMAFVHLGYVPKPGESFERDGLHVEVLEADERRVHRVRITAIDPATE
jgi:CBS domain containing-hemolysin-like protein